LSQWAGALRAAPPQAAGVRSRVLAEIVALFAPPACPACRAVLADAAAVVCPECRSTLPWLTGPRCPRCALPAPCAPCPARRAAFDRAWAPLEHAGPARALVNALKFEGALALADLMAAQIAAGTPPGLLGAGRSAALVPVPAHPARARRRGFDQAERLAAALARRTGLPLECCLRRRGFAGRQLGASRRARTAPGRIEVAAGGEVPEIAVLVDDVHTTGATLDACARTLRLAGSRSVVSLTYTRALRV
jgi:predicted amidophosphoribosyltransferase